MLIDGFEDFILVGRGGFSSVFRARQVGFDREVAIKLLEIDTDSDDVRQRFLNECELSGRLTGHPNIVTVLGSGFTTDTSQPYILMEFAPGGSLAGVIASSGAMPVAEAIRITVLLAGALDTAHRHGIVHRDVKPQNVVFQRSGAPGLTDFGIAAVSAYTGTSVASQALTPLHAAPELLEGRASTVASDIYGLGSTFFTMLQGHSPFGDRADTPFTLIGRVLNDPPPAVTAGPIPADLQLVVDSLLSKDPAARPALSELVAELNRIERSIGSSPTEAIVVDPPDGETIDSLPHHEMEPSPAALTWQRTRRRRRAWKVGLGVGVVGMLIATVGVTWAAARVQPSTNAGASAPTSAKRPSSASEVEGVQPGASYPTDVPSENTKLANSMTDVESVLPELGMSAAASGSGVPIDLPGLEKVPVSVEWRFYARGHVAGCGQMLTDPVVFTGLASRAYLDANAGLGVWVILARTQDPEMATQIYQGRSMEFGLKDGECTGEVADPSRDRLQAKGAKAVHRAFEMKSIDALPDVEYNTWTDLATPEIPSLGLGEPQYSYGVGLRSGRTVMQVLIAVFGDHPLPFESVESFASAVLSDSTS